MELSKQSDSTAQHDLRILVLDDEPFMVRVVAGLLEVQGFQKIRTCTSARFALECAVQPSAPVDIIILDLHMPEMDGIEFVRGLAARKYSGSLILVSGADERVLRAAEILIKAHSIRILGHLRKPFLADSLALLLDSWSSPTVDRNDRKTVHTSEDVETAIHHNELVNFYQPKVDILTGRVAGFETLVRWNHPQEGLVMPDEFIGIAEDNGLINALTRNVTRMAFQQARSWADSGYSMEIAINVSMDNLNQLDFPDFISEQSVALGVSPGHVVIEVTESRLMQDPRIPLEVLTRLSLKGFRLSVDDFGTGHSSLAQLQNLPFDELKVDRGFVHHAWLDSTTLAIYQASVGLAKRLNMSIVAEGVEDELDWNFLQRTKCGFAQGYFIGRPMPSDALIPWIERWRNRCDSELYPLGSLKERVHGGAPLGNMQEPE